MIGILFDRAPLRRRRDDAAAATRPQCVGRARASARARLGERIVVGVAARP
jgi:hypothetical protein